MPAHPFGLLYGSATPQGCGASIDKFRAPGCGFIANRQPSQATKDWFAVGRERGLEVLYYVDLMEAPTEWAQGGEELLVYGGQGTQLPDLYYWTRSRATASSRINYPGHWMLNIRVGSPWVDHVVAWARDFFQSGRANGWCDGLFLDVLGNHLWVPVWANTMSATERDEWTKGVHDMISRLRTAIGPEAIMQANNAFNDLQGYSSWTWSGSVRSVSQIAGALPTMAKGGHPGLNGNMFEGANPSINKHTVERVNNTINGGVEPAAPNGWEWATNANGRKRFSVISSLASSPNDLTVYPPIQNLAWVGAMPEGYGSCNQPFVSGTNTVAMADHIQGWTWSDPGGGGDVTPPTAPTGLTAVASGQNVTVTYTLPALDDRTAVVIARKNVPWAASELPTGGVVVTTRTSAADLTAGAHDFLEAGVPVGTWYYKAFTRDAAGNTQTGGPSDDVTVVAAGVFVWGPSLASAQLSVATVFVWGPSFGPREVTAAGPPPEPPAPVSGLTNKLSAASGAILSLLEDEKTQTTATIGGGSENVTDLALGELTAARQALRETLHALSLSKLVGS